MAKRNKFNRKSPQGKDRRISVRGVRRNPPDLQKFGSAIVALVLAQAEAEAEAEARRTRTHTEPGSKHRDLPSVKDDPDA